jgi:glycosyltransferase involved in cell wall biosynthesis
LGDRVQLLGYRTDVRDLLAAADLFVLASAFEGLPVSIMEAMSAGLPVVATAVGGVPEAVEDGVTGLLVPPRDAAALADALVSLADDVSHQDADGRRGRGTEQGLRHPHGGRGAAAGLRRTG